MGRNMRVAGALGVSASVRACAFLMALFALLIAGCARPASGKAPPKVVDGAIDLTGWDLEKDGPVPLDGEWRVVWDVLPDAHGDLPADSRSAPFRVPGLIDADQASERWRAGYGDATFSVRMRFGSGDHRATLAMGTLFPTEATCIAANGASTRAGRNTRSFDLDHESLAGYTLSLPRSDEVTCRLAIHVGPHRVGGYAGLQTAPVLGDAKDALDATEQRAVGSAAYTAMLATLALFFFAQWLLRRQDRDPKLVAALMGSVAFWFCGYAHIWDSVPWLGTPSRTRMEFTAMALVTFTGIPTLSALLQSRWTRLSRVLTVAALASALVCLLGPFAHLWQILRGAQAVGLACGVMMMATALQALLQPDQRWAARSIALGVLAPTIGGMLDIFLAWSFGLSLGFLVTGVVAFGAVLAFELARRNAEARNASERFGEATKKFVPAQFLHELGHADVTTAELGDAASRHVTVLFADIRNFTAMSERMSPEETFAFLNACLSRVGPHIRSNGGFVDKYIGDAIMALFPGHPSDATRATMAMQAEVAASNARHPERPPLAIGVGVHVGDVMMGTIGEAERFEATVISDTVNLTARLESLTKQLGCTVILTHDVFAALEEDLRAFTRRVGAFVVKGRAQAVTLYELFASDSPGLRDRKTRSTPLFDEMLAAHASGNTLRALDVAAELREACPEDGPAGWWFLRLTKECADDALPSSDGVVVLDAK